MIAEELFKAGVIELSSNEEIVNARFEMGVLLDFVLGEDRGLGHAVSARECNESEVMKTKELLRKRVCGYPLQYILGEWEFYGLRLFVGDGVLIPRADSEWLAKLLIDETKNGGRGLDLCSGSGAIAIAAAVANRESKFVAVELMQDAFNYLQKNKELHKADNLEAVLADVNLYSPIGEFDIIVANPPYLTQRDMEEISKEVSAEPEAALFGGVDGLSFYRSIAKRYKEYIKDGGRIAFEIGISMEGDVSDILLTEGYTELSYISDINGIIRVVHAKKS